MLISLLLIALLVLSSQAARAFSTQEYMETEEEQLYEENIYSSSRDDAGDRDDGKPGETPGPPDPPDPGLPPSVPSDPGNVSDKIGGFNGTTGSFVSFETIEEGISDHSLRLGEDEALSIFDEVTVESYEIYQEKSIGYTYSLQGNAGEMKIYDNPSALIKLNVNPLESERKVSFKIGDMEVTEEKKGTVEMSFEDDRMENYRGSLMTIETEDNQITPEIKDDFINYTLEGQAIFVFKMGGSDDFSNHMREEISNGDVGAEFRIESMEDGYKEMAVSYRDVNLIGNMKQDKKLEIMASSETLGEEGTVLFIDISSDVMDISSTEEIQLSIDGENASEVEDYEDLKERDDASYWLDIGDKDTYLLVNVPHFSSRSITIEPPGEISEEIPEEYWGSLAYYIPSAGISVGLITLGVLYRNSKKKKNGDNLVAIGSDPTKYNRNEGNEKRIKSQKKDKKQETRVRKE